MGKREVVDKTWKQISNKSQKISHFRAERGNERFFDFFEICFQVLPSISFFHCLVPAILLFPMPQVHASSPAHPQAHASSPCQVAKPMPQAHASLPQPSPSSMLQAQTPLPSLISSPCTPADAAGRAEMGIRSGRLQGVGVNPDRILKAPDLW